MTIGPAPMIRMLLRSLRFGIAHQLCEAIEEIPDVVRTRTRLGMPLETECRAVGAGEPLEGTVEERHVRRPEIVGDRSRIDRKAVVLAGDEHLAGVEVLHRVVRAMVAEF